MGAGKFTPRSEQRKRQAEKDEEEDALFADEFEEAENEVTDSDSELDGLDESVDVV